MFPINPRAPYYPSTREQELDRSEIERVLMELKRPASPPPLLSEKNSAEDSDDSEELEELDNKKNRVPSVPSSKKVKKCVDNFHAVQRIQRSCPMC